MSIAEEIERLNQLRIQGVLTEIEFQDAKNSLLKKQELEAQSQGPQHHGSAPNAFEAVTSNVNSNHWAVLLHLSQFSGYAIPLAGFIVPIVIWQIKKDEMPEIDEHGRIVANWMISSFLYMVISALLTMVLIGFLGVLVVAILLIIFPIIGALKAADGVAWNYPLSIRFF